MQVRLPGTGEVAQNTMLRAIQISKLVVRVASYLHKGILPAVNSDQKLPWGALAIQYTSLD